MSICAIICELNPLHFGHKKLIEKAKTISKCDYIMCILGGDFTQRGDIAILNKYERAKLACESGADIVIQIPTCYTCCSSEIFALAGIKIANSFKDVTHVCFGSECGELRLLEKAAKILLDEPDEYKTIFKDLLKSGKSFGTSKTLAFKRYCTLTNNTELEFILDGANNILGIEYIKAINTLKSNIKPITIKRESSHTIQNERDKYNSTYIRKKLRDDESITTINSLVPINTYNSLLKKEGSYKNAYEKYQVLLLYKLKTSTLSEISKSIDIEQGLHARIKKNADNTNEYRTFLNTTRTRRYSYAKIERISNHVLLGIDKSIIKKLYLIKKLPYIKVLAVSEKTILSKIKSTSNIIVNSKDAKKLKISKYIERILKIENNAEIIFNLTNNINNHSIYLYKSAEFYQKKQK